jgi:hypothetical protein
MAIASDGSGAPPAYQSAPMAPAPVATPRPATPAAPVAAPAPSEAPVNLPTSLGADPAYNAFLASLGLTDANLREAAALKGANDVANLGPNLAQNTQNTQQSLQRAGDTFAGRGLYNSSEKELAGSRIIGAGLNRADILQNNVATQIAQLQNALGLSVGDNQAKAAVQAQAAAGRQATQAALNAPNPFLAISATGGP